jgi:hypothetical protein
MMCSGSSGRDQGFGLFPPKADIQQAVSVNVREFAFVANESDAAEPVARRTDAGKLERASLDRLHGGYSPWVKKCCPRQKERVK